MQWQGRGAECELLMNKVGPQYGGVLVFLRGEEHGKAICLSLPGDIIVKLLVKTRVKKSEYIRVSQLVYTIIFLEVDLKSQCIKTISKRRSANEIPIFRNNMFYDDYFLCI